jgi:hypothetical protein
VADVDEIGRTWGRQSENRVLLSAIESVQKETQLSENECLSVDYKNVVAIVVCTKNVCGITLSNKFFLTSRLVRHLLRYESPLVSLPVHGGGLNSQSSVKRTWWFHDFDSSLGFQQRRLFLEVCIALLVLASYWHRKNNSGFK